MHLTLEFQSVTLKSMEVKANYAWNSKVQRENNPLLPNNIRGLIIGKSNCGKITHLLNFLLQPDGLDYTNLYVFW